ncbi:hypothetical protein DEV91_12157 [Phyllobacterium brassicacearum]|nr:hypothetical protein DEV91_12157 [Phyllobacterium brassicacearum]
MEKKMGAHEVNGHQAKRSNQKRTLSGLSEHWKKPCASENSKKSDIRTDFPS